MQRYKVVDTERKYTIGLKLIDRQNIDNIKYFNITTGEMVSILYIDKLSQIGEEKEYIINGRVVSIIAIEDPRCEVCKDYNAHYKIELDISDKYGSKIVTMDPHRILDIHEYPYEYDLVENPILIPNPLKDGFFVHETKDDTRYDITTPNDPLITDADEEENTNE